MKSSILLTFLIFYSSAIAQFIPLGTRSISLNQQQVLVTEQAGTTFLNPSQLLDLPQASIWLTHYKPYRIADLPVIALALHYRTQGIALGAGLVDFGNTIYRDQNFCLAGAFALTQKFRLGIKYQLRRLAISSYGQAQVSSLDAGFHLPVAEHITIGALIKNAYAGKIAGISPPREVLAAVRIDLDQSLVLYSEIAQVAHFDAENRFGVEYHPVKNLEVRLGTGLHTPAAASAGFGIALKMLQISYAMQSHPALDATHIFSLAIARQK